MPTNTSLLPIDNQTSDLFNKYCLASQIRLLSTLYSDDVMKPVDVSLCVGL